MLRNTAGGSAVTFWSFVASVFRTDDHRLSSHMQLHNFKLFVSIITTTKFQAHLERISINNSNAPDEIRPQLLRIPSPVITEYPALLFNPSLESEVTPDDWFTSKAHNFMIQNLVKICSRCDSCASDCTSPSHLYTARVYTNILSTQQDVLAWYGFSRPVGSLRCGEPSWFLGKIVALSILLVL